MAQAQADSEMGRQRVAHAKALGWEGMWCPVFPGQSVGLRSPKWQGWTAAWGVHRA